MEEITTNELNEEGSAEIKKDNQSNMQNMENKEKEEETVVIEITDIEIFDLLCELHIDLDDPDTTKSSIRIALSKSLNCKLEDFNKGGILRKKYNSAITRYQTKFDEENQDKENNDNAEMEKSRKKKKHQKKKKKRKSKKKNRKRKRNEMDISDADNDQNDAEPNKKKRKTTAKNTKNTEPYQYTLTQLKKLLRATHLANPKVYKQLKQMDSNKKRCDHIKQMLDANQISHTSLSDQYIAKIKSECDLKREMADLGVDFNNFDKNETPGRPKRKRNPTNYNYKKTKIVTENSDEEFLNEDFDEESADESSVYEPDEMSEEDMYD